MKDSGELAAAYVPVVQQGYIDFFDRHPGATIGIFDTDITQLFNYVRKDIRALDPELAFKAVEGLGYTARFIGQTALRNILLNTDTRTYLADDDVSHDILDILDVPESRVIFEPVFLRWDRRTVKADREAEPDTHVDVADLNADIITLIDSEQSRSNNSWRHVGAVLAHGDTILASGHNHSLPSPYTSVTDGDPRNTAHRGDSIGISNDIHAETDLIARMARDGQPIDGSDIYVTTFPCPNCAKVIATAGISRCYYGEGYAMLDGGDVLKRSGVELIKIDGLKLSADPDASRLYPPQPR